MKYAILIAALVLSAGAYAKEEKVLVVKKDQDYYLLVPSCEVQSKVRNVWVEDLRKNSLMRIETEKDTKRCRVVKMLKATA